MFSCPQPNQDQLARNMAWVIVRVLVPNSDKDWRMNQVWPFAVILFLCVFGVKPADICFYKNNFGQFQDCNKQVLSNVCSLFCSAGHKLPKAYRWGNCPNRLLPLLNVKIIKYGTSIGVRHVHTIEAYWCLSLISFEVGNAILRLKP